MSSTGRGPIPDSRRRSGAPRRSSSPFRRRGGEGPADRFADAIAAAPNLARIVYFSTVGVYGEHGGRWVDETAATLTRSERGLARLADEARWTEAGRARGAAVDILRLPGIYGPGRNALERLRAGRGAPDRQAGPCHQPRPCRRHRGGRAARARERPPRADLERRRRRARPAAGRHRLRRGAARRSARRPRSRSTRRRFRRWRRASSPRKAGHERQGQGAARLFAGLSELSRGP